MLSTDCVMGIVFVRYKFMFTVFNVVCEKSTVKH